MRKPLVGLLAAFFCFNVSAGTAKFTGEGKVSTAPEFVTVHMQVSSECFLTPEDAMKANDATVITIQNFLKTLINEDSEVDKISTQGGYTRPYSRMIREGNETRTLCDGTFQKTTSISFTASPEGFSKKFATIQNNILKNFKQGSDTTEESRTFVSLNEPSAGVCPKTLAQMDIAALQNAGKQSRGKFDAMALTCGINGQVEVCSISEEGTIFRPSNKYASAAFSESDEVVELNFDDITVTKSVIIEYAYGQTFFMCGEGR